MKIQTFDEFIRYDFFMDKDGNVLRKSEFTTEYDSVRDVVYETRKDSGSIHFRYVIYFRVQFDVPKHLNWNSEQIWDEAERQYKEGLANAQAT